MITHDPRVIRVWKRRLRAIPGPKRRKSTWWVRLRKQRAWSALRFVIPVGIAFACATGASIEKALELMVIWTCCVTMGRAKQIADSMTTPAGLIVFYHLPVTNAEVFLHFRMLWLRSSVWLGIDWMALGMGFALAGSGPDWWGVAITGGLAQAAMAIAVAVWLARLFPRIPFGVVSYALGVAIFLALQFERSAVLSEFVTAPVVEVLTIVTPAGWLSGAIGAAGSGEPIGWIAISIAALFGTLASQRGLVSIRERFRMETVFGFDDFTADVARESRDGAVADSEKVIAKREAVGEEPGASANVDADELRKRIRTALESPEAGSLAARGAIERMIVRLLPRRSRVLVDVFRPSGVISWTSAWCVALGALVAERVLGIAGVPDGIRLWLIWIGVPVFSLPLLGGVWPGFSGVSIFGTTIGMHSYFPIGFWEGVRVFLGVNALRVLAAWPLAIIAIRYSFGGGSLGWGESSAIATSLLLIVLAGQPMFAVTAFSATSNDTRSRWWLTVLILGAMIVGALFLIATLTTIFVGENRGYGIAVAALFLIYMHSCLFCYGLARRAGLFDLVRVGD